MTFANKTKMSLLLGSVMAGLLWAAPNAALAGEPSVEGELILELQNDYAFNSDDPDNELNDTYGSSELATTIHVNNFIDINTGFIFENVLENNHTRPGKDRFFNGHGAYIDSLNIQLNLSESTSVLGGKFAPSFGTAWDVTPGIYGVDFAEDYELSEQLGFAIGHNFGTEHIGTTLLTANVFTTDTSFMSNSVGAVRGKARKISGGAGNTEDLNNYSVTLDLGDIRSIEGLSVHLGYRHLAKGVDSSNAENGYVAGFVYETQLSEELTAALNSEFTHLSHAGGGADDQNFFTAGFSFGYGQWHLDVSGTQRNTEVAAGTDVKDALFQISLGYTDAYETDWNIGYKFAEEGGIDTEIFGLFVTKTFGFEG